MSRSDSNTDAPVETPRSNWEGVARGAAYAFANGVGEGEPELLRELLVFGLDDSAYAIAVERVREIVRLRQMTNLPRSPEWMLGVIALRGEVVEVVDLRKRLGLRARTPDRSSRIIVLHGDTERVTGVLVDSVSEVYRVAEESIMPAQSLDVSAITEVCRRGEAFVSILDPETALGFEDE